MRCILWTLNKSINWTIIELGWTGVSLASASQGTEHEHLKVCLWLTTGQDCPSLIVQGSLRVSITFKDQDQIL